MPRPEALHGIIFERGQRLLEHGVRVVNGWKDAKSVIGFHSREAHVWAVRTDVPGAVLVRLSKQLPEEERRRAERIRDGSTLRGFVVGRSRLRVRLAGVLGVAPASIALRTAASGKPELSEPGSGLTFSIAHSGDVVLVAVAAVDVGVDIERVRPVRRAARVSERVFPERTLARLGAVSDSEREDAFFAAWAQHEALVKAVGGRLLMTRDPLEFDWPPLVRPRVYRESSGAVWTVAHLPPLPGYAAALVAAGELERVHLWRDSAG